MRLIDQLELTVTGIEDWSAGYGHRRSPDSLTVSDERSAEVLGELVGRLHDNYPFFHPRYAGQMLKPPHPAAVVGYVDGDADQPQQPRARRRAGDGSAWRRRSSPTWPRCSAIAAAPRPPDQQRHDRQPRGAVRRPVAAPRSRRSRYSADAHYTHARMCGLLGVESDRRADDGRGRMDLDALADLLAAGRVGTVVATAGTTGLGAVDPVHEIVALCARRTAPGSTSTRRTAASSAARRRRPTDGSSRAVAAIADCDSVVVDPHKHGLQPYGCGAVLFRDPAVGPLLPARLAVHLLHLRRAAPRRDLPGVLAGRRRGGGAVADAPAAPARRRTGLRPVLAAVPPGGLAWARLVDASDELAVYQPPSSTSSPTSTARHRRPSAVDASSDASCRPG